MDKTSEQYEAEIVALKQQLLEARTQCDEYMNQIRKDENFIKKEIDWYNQRLRKMSKLIEILLNQIESEEK